MTSLILSSAHAIEKSTLNSNVRALGMGDAYTAVADDDSSLFYNPAGLARVRGLNWKIFDVDASVSGVTAYQKVANLKGSGTGNSFAQQISPLYGEHIGVGAGGESIFTMPMIGFGVYDHLGSTIRINNPFIRPFTPASSTTTVTSRASGCHSYPCCTRVST